MRCQIHHQYQFFQLYLSHLVLHFLTFHLLESVSLFFEVNHAIKPENIDPAINKVFIPGTRPNNNKTAETGTMLLTNPSE